MNEMMRRIMSREEQLHLAALINAERHQKLHELGRMIRGTSYAGPERERTKGASSTGTINNNNAAGGVNNNNAAGGVNNNNPKYPRHYKVLSDKQRKLKELGKMIKGR